MGILDAFKSQNTLIAEAILAKNYETLISLLDDNGKYDINHIDKGESFLSLACSSNDLDICEAILSKKPNINSINNSLLYATSTSKYELSKLLLDNEANPNFKTIKKPNSINNAINSNSINLFLLLVEYGAHIDFNILTAFTQKIKQTQKKQLDNTEISYTLLLKATELGFLKAIQSIIINLDIKLDNDIGGDIIKILQESEPHIAKKLLVKRIADFNKNNAYTELQGSDTTTILNIATQEGISSSIFIELIKNKEQDSYLNYVDYLKILHDNTLVVDTNGNTILHFFALIGDAYNFQHLWDLLKNDVKKILNKKQQSIQDCAIIACHSNTMTGKKINTIFKPNIVGLITGNKPTTNIEPPIEREKNIQQQHKQEEIRIPQNTSDLKSEILLYLEQKQHQFFEEIQNQNKITIQKTFDIFLNSMQKTVSEQILESQSDIKNYVSTFTHEINDKINLISNMVDKKIETNDDAETILILQETITTLEDSVQNINSKLMAGNSKLVDTQLLESSIKTLENKLKLSIQEKLFAANKKPDVSTPPIIAKPFESIIQNLTAKLGAIENSVTEIQKQKITSNENGEKNTNTQLTELHDYIFKSIVPNNQQIDEKINQVYETIQFLDEKINILSEIDNNKRDDIQTIKEELIKTLDPLKEMLDSQKTDIDNAKQTLSLQITEQSKKITNTENTINKTILAQEQLIKNNSKEVHLKIDGWIKKSDIEITSIKKDIDVFDQELTHIEQIENNIIKIKDKIAQLATITIQNQSNDDITSKTTIDFEATQQLSKPEVLEAIEQIQSSIPNRPTHTEKPIEKESKILNPDLYSKIQNLINSNKK